MAKKKIIGYQLVNHQECIVPCGLFSWQVFRNEKQAKFYAKHNGIVLGDDWTIEPVNEGDIEQPCFIGGYKSLEEILREYFNCKKPLKKDGSFTERGLTAYNCLIGLIDHIGLLTEQDTNKIVAKLDEISDSDIY